MNLILNLEQALRILEPVAIAILLSRIAAQRLLSLYKAFAAYLVIWLCQDIAPVALGLNLGGDRYALFFFISEPFAWILSYLVLIELFDLTLADFPGIRSAGRILLYAGILLSAVVAAAMAVPSLLHLGGTGWLYIVYMVIERSVMVLSLILLGALQVLMVRSRLQLPLNTVRYSRVYAIHFATRALQVFVFGELDRKLVSVGNVAASVIDIACVGYLAFTLSRTGVHAQEVTGVRLSEQDRRQLREQLQKVNDLLGRLSRTSASSKSQERGSGEPTDAGSRGDRRS